MVAGGREWGGRGDGVQSAGVSSIDDRQGYIILCWWGAGALNRQLYSRSGPLPSTLCGAFRAGPFKMV